MTEWVKQPISKFVNNGDIEFGRGNIISKIDIQKNPGSYPIYSSSAKGDGKMGEYGNYMFDEELITWSVDGGGYLFYRPKHKFSVTNVCGFIRVHSSKIDYRFLHYLLSYEHSQLTFDYQTKAHPSVIKKLYYFVPIEISEQQAIANILSTIDEVITQSESLVRKYQSIKQGLMFDLLTRGVDENGELSETNDLVDTKIGSLPRRWAITSLGELISKYGGLIQTGPFGSQLHSYDYVELGTPVVMPQDIMKDGKISEENIARIRAEKTKELRRHILKPNDVVFARRGDLSRCSAITLNEAGWLCGTGSMLVRSSKKEIDARWLAAIYRHEIGQHQIRARAVGSTMVNLNSTLLRDLIIPKPSLSEQTMIMDIIESQENLVKKEEESFAKLQLLKQGLMQDLLSGQVRVKV